MKNIIALAACLCFITLSMAQTTPACETVSLKTDADVKSAEPCVTKAADYVLAQPLHTSSELYTEYRKFIMAWMEKTPDYTFSLNGKMAGFSTEADNVQLLGVYMACMSKAALEGKKDFYPQAIKLFVDFVSNPANKVKQTAKLKKLIEDYKANKIEKYYK